METGQLIMMQMPNIATNPVAMAAPTPTQSMSAENSSGSDFAAVLHSAMPVTVVDGELITTAEIEQAFFRQIEEDGTKAVLLAVMIPTLPVLQETDLAQAKEEPADLETESAGELIAKVPQEVVDVSGALVVQALHSSGRMPEPEQSLAEQIIEAHLQPVASSTEVKQTEITSLKVTDTEIAEATAAIKIVATEQTDAISKSEKDLPKPVASGVEISAETAGSVKTRMEPAMPAVVRTEVANASQDGKASIVVKQEQMAVLEPRQPDMPELPVNLPQPATRDTAKSQQASVQQIMEAYSQPAATKPVPVAEDSPAIPVDTVPRINRAVETGAAPVQLAVKVNEPQREERILQPSSADSSGKVAADNQNLLATAVKEPASVPQEDASAHGNPLFDQKMTGHVHHAAQQAINTAAPATVGSTPEQTQPATVTENVVKQVSERITAQEIKSGSEQIVLRLTPENLGELKVNLRMENQRLTVEIITENKTVTDALRQNSDSLKETLAKQNIKMDSFDVSTGSNGQDSLAGKNSRNLGEWQEMARNRQANQWLQGGYNIPAVAAADNAIAMASYRSNGLVDGHF